MTERRMYEPIRYVFTAEEIKLLGEQLARETQTVFDIERLKAAAVSQFTADLKAANKKVAETTTRINNGFEVRDVECMAILEDPRPGQKRIVRMDTNDTVRIEPMTMAEMQSTFGFREDSDDEGGGNR